MRVDHAVWREHRRLPGRNVAGQHLRSSAQALPVHEQLRLRTTLAVRRGWSLPAVVDDVGVRRCWTGVLRWRVRELRCRVVVHRRHVLAADGRRYAGRRVHGAVRWHEHLRSEPVLPRQLHHLPVRRHLPRASVDLHGRRRSDLRPRDDRALRPLRGGPGAVRDEVRVPPRLHRSGHGQMHVTVVNSAAEERWQKLLLRTAQPDA